MNPKVIIIASVLIIIMIFSGKNPIEEAKKAEEERYKGVNDPLMRAIQDYHDDGSVLGAAKGNGLGEDGRRAKRLPEYMYSKERRGSTRNQRSDGLPERTTERPVPQGRNNGYYPPPPLPPENNTRQQRQRSNPLRGSSSPRSKLDSRNYLNSGQLLAYEGTKVFYVDAQGRNQPLPDGKYITGDGREILISGGNKTLASN